jgi:hypothetical protein
MSQPPMDEDFQDRIQHILNEKKKEDLRKQFGMSFEGHSAELSPQAEIDYSFEIKNIAIRGDDGAVQAQIVWHGIPKDKKVIVKHEGLSNFKLARSVYGGWDIVQAGIPGWDFRKK